MTDFLYPWHNALWGELQGIRARLPHAILFHGAAGLGKKNFAEKFAQSLLCESIRADRIPCGVCVSCRWFTQYNHPDYRRVRPEIFEECLDDQSNQEENIDGKITRSSKSPSKEIKIDQVRALVDFMNVSTHRHGSRVVVLYPVESLNIASSNALLKMLEEPPPATCFLLVTDQIDRLLPTILSRCRQYVLHTPARDNALHWLRQKKVLNSEYWLDEQGGAPLSAYQASLSESNGAASEIFSFFSRPDMASALAIAEKHQKIPLLDWVTWQQRWLYDLFSYKLSGRVRYYPRYLEVLTHLSGRVSLSSLLMGLKKMSEAKVIATHPLSPRLFIEAMLLNYSRFFVKE